MTAVWYALAYVIHFCAPVSSGRRSSLGRNPPNDITPSPPLGCVFGAGDADAKPNAEAKPLPIAPKKLTRRR